MTKPLCLSMALAIIALFPVQTHAVTITEWNFRASQIPGRWDVRGLAPTPSDSGLSVSTPEEGELTRSINLPHRIDDIIVHVLTPSSTEAVFLWHRRSTPSSEMIQLPFTIPASTHPTAIELNISSFPEWDPHTDRIGFAFPQGANIVIDSIELIGLTWWERGIVAVQSFWTLDRYKPHSINFVWGPLLTFTPIAKKHLFYVLPPLAYSANSLFYGSILILGIGCILYSYKKKWTSLAYHRSIAVFLSVIAAAWTFYDIRMGTEWLSYIRRDIQSYLLPEESLRSFRERGKFYTLATTASTALIKENTYIFLATHRWPYLGLMRYLTYPSIPTDPDQAQFGVNTWIIFERPDIVVDPSGQLLAEGKILAPRGKVLYRLDDQSFIFRTK